MYLYDRQTLRAFDYLEIVLKNFSRLNSLKAFVCRLHVGTTDHVQKSCVYEFHSLVPDGSFSTQFLAGEVIKFNYYVIVCRTLFCRRRRPAKFAVKTLLVIFFL